MGKASKWIRNILLGKKEENFKKIDAFCPENKKENTDSSSSSNKIIVRRKWSFRKITSGKTTEKVVSHNISRSFDSTDHSPKLQTQTPRSRRLSRLAKVSENTEFVKTAATRIQSVFRSYLAKRALHALRGLVKLQALVRGHLVRKQTTATLRGMHALMAIQVRARIQRIKMTEEVNPVEIQPPPHKEIPSFKGHMTQQNKDSKNMSVEEMLGVMRSRSGPLDVKSKKYEYSKSESISKRENQLKKTIITAPNSPEKYYKEMIEYLKPTTKSSDERHIMPHRQSCSPNFMNKTESSKAKTRCRSEPKQRPPKGVEGTTKQKSKAIECRLMKQNMLSNSARYEHWIVNSMKQSSKRDSFGSYTDDDSYYS